MVKILHLISFTNTPITFAESCTSLSFRNHNPGWKVWLWIIHNGLPPLHTTTYIETLNPDNIHIVTIDSFYSDIHMCNFLNIDPTDISHIGVSIACGSGDDDYSIRSLDKIRDITSESYTNDNTNTIECREKATNIIKTMSFDFNVLTNPIVFSHVLRYYILYKHGGLYSDIDVIFTHRIPFRLDRNVLFVSPDKYMHAYYPAGLFYAHKPGEFIWKHLAYASMTSEKVVGIAAYGTILLNSIFPFDFDPEGTVNENLEEIENILGTIFPNVCMIDSRTYRPVPHTKASQLVSYSPDKKYKYLLANNDPYRCFALQWYRRHTCMDMYENKCFPRKTILGNAFRTYFVQNNMNTNHRKKRNKNIIKSTRSRIGKKKAQKQYLI